MSTTTLSHSDSHNNDHLYGHGGRDGKRAAYSGKFSAEGTINPMLGDKESFRTPSIILQTRHPQDGESEDQENQNNQPPMSRESFLKLLDEQEDEDQGVGDVGAINTSFYRYRISELSILTLVTLSWLCGSMATDIEYWRFSKGENLTEDNSTDDAYGYLLLSISTSSTILLEAAIVIRYQLFMTYRRAMGLYTKMDTLLTTGLMRWMIFDMFTASFHPVWFLYGFQYDRTNSYVKGTGIYEINTCLNIIQVFFRLHLCARALASFSRYAEGRSQRVCGMNGANASWMFIFRALMKKKPLMLLSFTFSFSIVICGYCFRVFERPFMEFTDQDFENPRTGMWCVILTMTTVGYGDFFPVSDEGRFVGAFACIWGVILVSLMVVSLSNLLELKPGEKKAHTILNRLRMRKKMKRWAGLVIGYAGYRHLMKRKYGVGSTELKDAHLTYLKVLRGFQDESRRARSIFDKSEFESVERDLVRMQNRSEEISDVFTKLAVSQARAKGALSNLICQLRAIDSLSRMNTRI
eukprot:CAMPEP_0115038524 /NCGR_PEP_ID=MMETSP0216-20121206/43458_1 /TAXON_ID=223996 /ORGANISM="Protocruzia adherens, Strain Boccale" /LENGTH=522 /DNA_ID=CAMNT_0002418937 /DNA_START=144 /DNA_END=1712 /DNA_ORIENTATION=-